MPIRAQNRITKTLLIVFLVLCTLAGVFYSLRPSLKTTNTSWPIVIKVGRGDIRTTVEEKDFDGIPPWKRPGAPPISSCLATANAMKFLEDNLVASGQEKIEVVQCYNSNFNFNHCMWIIEFSVSGQEQASKSISLVVLMDGSVVEPD